MNDLHILIWKNCLEYIKERIEPNLFKIWFEPIIPLQSEDKILTIQVPSQYFFEFVEDKFAQVIKEAITKEMGKGVQLQYSVVVENETGNKANSTPLKEGTSGSIDNTTNPYNLDNMGKGNNLNPTYTFDNLVEGKYNSLARSAGYSVAKNPGRTSFNPLMIYGNVGLGKTHLVQAIGNEIKKNHPEKKVVYVTTEKFTNQYVSAVVSNDKPNFQAYYSEFDILILDDVHFLKGKTKTQEIFFNIFNDLYQNDKQIVITSDCAPKDLQGLEERVVSRLQAGLTADLSQPSFETRKAIIQHKIKEDGITISEEVVDYIADMVCASIRELEGVIVTLAARASLLKGEITMEDTKDVLKQIVKEFDTEVRIEGIQKKVSDCFRVSLDNLTSKSRKKEIVIARQVGMYLAKSFTEHSLKTIGYHFGGRDHSTVSHALKTVNDMMYTNSKFKKTVEELQETLKERTPSKG